MPGHDIRLTRRALLRGGGMVGVALLVPLRAGGPALAVGVGEGATGYLDPSELETLRAAVDRFIPGPPEDPDPGAAEAGCAEAIDALLAAFSADPPRIYAGAPFSDRAGHPENHFLEFVPLDSYEAMAWRLRIEGSRGRDGLEFNGPVAGYQQIYREGLAALDESTPGPARFSDAPGPTRDMILRRSDDPAIEAFVDVAFIHTLQLMYGAPEYGGNPDAVSWDFTNFQGDTQPRGWTREEVEDPYGSSSPPSALPALPTGAAAEDFEAIAALGSTEAFHHMLARSDGRLRGLQAEAAKIRRYRDGG